MPKLNEVFEKISNNEDLIEKLGNSKENKDVYKIFTDCGFCGSSQELENEMKQLLNKSLLSDDQLEDVSGGISNKNACRFESTALTILFLSSFGNLKIDAKESLSPSPISKNITISDSNDKQGDFSENSEQTMQKIKEELKKEAKTLKDGIPLEKKDISEKLRKFTEISCEMSIDAYYSRIESIGDTAEVKKEKANAMKEIEDKNYTFFGNYNGESGGVMKINEVLGKKYLFIAFQGAKNTNDVITDAIFKMKECDFLEGKKVHMGFYDRFNVLCRLKNKYSKVGNCDQEMRKLLKGQNVDGIVITGHSLGGALATLQALNLQQNSIYTGKVNLITFCSPRVLSREACEVAKKVLIPQVTDENKPFVLRIWRKGDIVTKMPYGKQGFMHYGKSWCVTKNHSKLYETAFRRFLSWFKVSDWKDYFDFSKYHSILKMQDDINNLDNLVKDKKIVTTN